MGKKLKKYAQGGPTQGMKDNYEQAMGWMKANNYNVNDPALRHDKSIGTGYFNAYNKANPDKQFNTQDIPVMQQYFQQNAGNDMVRSTNPYGRGFSPVDNYPGDQTLNSRQMVYATEHYDRYGKLVPQDSRNFGTNQGAASQQHDYNIANPVQQQPEWQSNDQGVPVTADSQQPVQRPQQDNWHTNESSDYSIDSTRESQYGGYMKQKQQGGVTNPPGMYWDGSRYVKAKGTGTYQNGDYFQTGGTAHPAHAPSIQEGFFPQNNNIPFDRRKSDSTYYDSLLRSDPQAARYMFDQYNQIPPALGKPTIDAYNAAYRTQSTEKHPPYPIHLHQYGGQYYQPYLYSEDGGNITELQFGGPHVQEVQQYPERMKDGGYWQFYGYPEDGGNITELKDGGIHIKPENRGKFTAYKKRTGKTTEEALHSSDPHVRKMANFARNAKKWHHETGGPVNPFRPMYAGGGPTDEQSMQLPGPSATAYTGDPYSPTISSNTPYMGADMMDNSDMSYMQPPQAPGTQPKRRGMNNGLTNLLQTGLAAGAYFNNQRSAKDTTNWQREQGLTGNQFRVENSNPHGQYDQQGRLAYSPVSQPGYYNPPMAMGGYVPGSEHTLSTQEINRLRKLGYQLQEI